jgi:hypothetical protein
MSVDFRVGESFWLIGAASFASSFFDTVHCLLEKGEWGETYPYLLKGLCDEGRLAWEDAPRLKTEVDDIHAKLKAFPPSAVVWDKDDRSKKPPWGDEIFDEKTNMSNYFVTADGQDLFEVLYEAIGEAINAKEDLEIM